MLTIGPVPRWQPQRLHVLHVLVERVFGRIAACRSALAAMVEIDELHPLRERREGGLEAGVVGSGAAVDDERDRALAHGTPFGHQTHALDIEIELRIPHLGAHGTPSRYGSSQCGGGGIDR